MSTGSDWAFEPDWAFVRRLTDSIGRHSLLDFETAKKLALDVYQDLGFSTETSSVLGAEYLGGLEITRASTGWFKR